MKDQEQDSLWDLLGEVRSAKIPPRFTDDVLRKIREEADAREQPSFLDWLARAWKIPVASAALATLLIVASYLQFGDRPGPSRDFAAATLAENPDFEVIADLDILIASEDNSVWLENPVVF